jgi:acyl carrier protein
MTLSQKAEIKQWVIENFASDVTADQLPDDYDLLENGIITSLSLVRLVTLLSDRFDLSLDAADLRPEFFRSVEAIDQFVSRSPQAGLV